MLPRYGTLTRLKAKTLLRSYYVGSTTLLLMSKPYKVWKVIVKKEFNGPLSLIGLISEDILGSK